MGSHLIRALASLALLVLACGPAWAQSSETPSAEIPEIPSAPVAPVQLYEADYGHNITLRGTAEYIYATADLLDSMAELPSGAAILRELGESGKGTLIAAIPTEGNMGPHVRATDPAGAVYQQEGIALEPGSGSDSLVFMNPDYTRPGLRPEIIMGHELLHALHVQEGEFNNNVVTTPGTGRETILDEFRAIGTFGFEDEALSENQLRREWNQAHPDRPVPLDRNGHGIYDYGPSRRPETAPSSSRRPVARPQSEGASQVLERALRGGN